MKKLAQKTKLILGIVLTLLTLSMFGYYYLTQMEKLIYERSSQEVIVVSNQIVNLLQDKANSYFVFLKNLSQMDSIANPDVTIDEKLRMLKMIRQNKHGVYLGISYLDGKASTSDNRLFTSDSLEYAFIKQTDGLSTSNQIFSQNYGVPILIYKEALKNSDNKIIGFIFLIEEIPSLLQGIKSSAYLSKNMLYRIVDANNYTFTPSIDHAKHDVFKKKFTLSKIYNDPAYKKAMQNNQTYYRVINFNKIEYFVCITPVKIAPNWFVVTSIQNKFLSSQNRDILNLSILTFFLVGTALSALIVYLTYIQREYLQRKSLISTVFKSSDFYYLELSSTEKIIRTNLSFRKKTGFKNNYLTSHYLHNICVNTSTETILKLIGQRDPFELEILTNQNQIMHVKWLNLSPNKKLLQLIGVDFTTQKEAAQLTHDQLEQNNLQMIFNNIPIPLILRKLDNTIIMVNSALNSFTNKDCNDFIGKPFQDVIKVEDPLSLQRDLEQSFNLSSAVTTETTIITQDGSSLYFSTTQVPLFDKNLTPSSILTVFVDVTGSKNYSDFLKKELSRMHEMLETSPVGVVISVDGIVRFANPYAQEIALAHVGEPTINTTIDVDIYKEMAKELLCKKNTSQQEIRTIGQNGQINYILVSAATTTFQEKPGVIIWGVNINKVKEIEEELIFARDIAESATSAKSSFLANMSHEIRTPMNAIFGMNHLLKQTQLTLKQEDYVDKIDISAKSLLCLLNDILDFSRIEAHQLKIELNSFQLDVPIINLTQIFRLCAEEKGLTLNLNYDKTLPTYVRGDSSRIYQALQNILSNSVKFTHTGSINVSIINEKTENNFASITFKVQDTGIGMTDRQCKSSIESFTQADESTTRKYGGVGLGISICKQLVELMGGTVYIQSEKNKGTIFLFNLNLEIAEKPAMEKERTTSFSALKGCNILLAEDNFINQQVATEILNNVNINVDIANNGLEAVDMALKKEYTFILVDIQMPEMDGLTATKEMRKHDKLKDVPIIAMTANAMAGDKEKALKAGMNDYVTKPINPNLLYDTLLRWLPAQATTFDTEQITTEKNEATMADNTTLYTNIRGLDYNSALKRLMGNEKLFSTLVTSFHKDFSASTTAFREMLNLDKIQDKGQAPQITEESIRLAHTIKSVAGNLSMANIQSKAAEIEAMLNNNAVNVQMISQLLDEYELTLQPTMTDIRNALSSIQNENSDSAVEQKISPEQKQALIEAIDETISLLEKNDPDAEIAFTPVHILLKTQYKPKIEKALKALDSFDFDKAKLILTELTDSLKLNG